MAMGLLCIPDSAWLIFCPQPGSWRPQWVINNPLYLLEALHSPAPPIAAHNMLSAQISIVRNSF